MKLFSIGAKFGFNFKVMRTEVILSITVFKIIVTVIKTSGKKCQAC